MTTPWTPRERADSGYDTGERCRRVAPPTSTVTPGESLTTCGAAASGNVFVTNQHVASRTQSDPASAENDFAFDIRTSFKIETTRCFKWRFRRNSGAGA